MSNLHEISPCGMLDSSPRSEIPAPSPTRLDYIDGLRGLAALYVVLYHTVGEVSWGQDAEDCSPFFLRLLQPFSYGQMGVAVFIVLSGFCLMLPVARTRDGRLRGGVVEFFKRRSRRILPPYFGALVLSLLIFAMVPGMLVPSGARSDKWLPVFQPDILLSHVFLFHNWSVDWYQKINGPMWSIAPEWQIYFLFPSLLLPLWRRGGIASLLIMSFLLGLGPHFLLPGANNLDWSCPWFLGLFALGMTSALVILAPHSPFLNMMRQLPWGWIASFLWLFLAFVIIRPGQGTLPQPIAGRMEWVAERWWNRPNWFQDMTVGLAAATLVIFCGQRLVTGQILPLRFLGIPSIVLLGGFSYTLYLIHSPIQAGLHLLMRNWGMSANLRLWVLLFLGVPLILLSAYLLHLVWERPFMSTKTNPSSEKKVSPSVTLVEGEPVPQPLPIG